MTTSPPSLLPCRDSELFAAIRRHRAASTCLLAQERALRADVEGEPERLPTVENAALAEGAALKCLLQKAPTTMAGLMALLSYMAEALTRDGDVLDEDSAMIFVRLVSAAAGQLTNFGNGTRAVWFIE